MFLAQHLTILRNGFAAVDPRRYVICFHFFNGIVSVGSSFARAIRTNAPLFFVGLTLLTFGKGAYVEIFFKDIFPFVFGKTFYKFAFKRAIEIAKLFCPEKASCRA